MGPDVLPPDFCSSVLEFDIDNATPNERGTACNKAASDRDKFIEDMIGARDKTSWEELMRAFQACLHIQECIETYCHGKPTSPNARKCHEIITIPGSDL